MRVTSIVMKEFGFGRSERFEISTGPVLGRLTTTRVRSLHGPSAGRTLIAPKESIERTKSLSVALASWLPVVLGGSDERLKFSHTASPSLSERIGLVPRTRLGVLEDVKVSSV